MSTIKSLAVMAVIIALAAFVLPASAYARQAHKKSRLRHHHKIHAVRAVKKAPAPLVTVAPVTASPVPDSSMITIIDNDVAVRQAPVSKPAAPILPAPVKDRKQSDTARGLMLLDQYDGSDAGLLDEAETLFARALKAEPQDAPASVGLSRVEMCRGYLTDGKFDDRRLTRALTLTDRALDASPGFGPAHLQRGYLFLYLGSLGLAEAEADRASKAGSPASRLYGEVAMRRGDTGKAKEYWENAVTEAGENDGERADSYDALGEVAMSDGDFQAAAGYFKEALSLRPSSSWESSNYGLALVRMGRIDEAIEVLSFSLLHKEFPEARANLAVAYLRKGVSLQDRGDSLQAEVCYKKAIENDPKLMPAYKDLAALYERAGEKDKAAGLCRKAMEADPKDPWAADTLKGLDTRK